MKKGFFRRAAGGKETAINVETIYARLADGSILEIKHTGTCLDISTDKPSNLVFEEVEKTTTRVRVM